MTDRDINLQRLENELASAKKECESLSSEMNETRKNIRREVLSNLKSARSAFNEANAAHETADDARDECRAALCGCVIGQREADEVHEEVAADLKLSYELKRKAFRKNSPKPAVYMFLAAVLFAVLGVVWMWYFYVPAAAFAAVGVALMLHNNKRVKESNEARKSRSDILAKYKAEDEEEIKLREAEFTELHSRFTEAEQIEYETAKILAAAGKALEDMENRALSELDFTGGLGEGACITRQYNEKLRQLQELESKISRLQS